MKLMFVADIYKHQLMFVAEHLTYGVYLNKILLTSNI
jgi:hypothetical protein